MIDPRDVGAAAAGVVSTAGHDRRTYVLTGAEAITYAQVADELSAATAREVEYVDVPDKQAKQAMIREGLSDFGAQQVVNVFAMLRQGVSAQVTSTVESLTGRSARLRCLCARPCAPVRARRRGSGTMSTQDTEEAP
ncbi:MAG: hypothetical protein WBP81_09920 [Solirubrobacteraceae bacterium]